VTVDGLPVAGQIDGCSTLSEIRTPADHWGAGQIFPGIEGPKVFDGAHIPNNLRHGSLLGNVVRDGIATVDVYDRNRVVETVHVRNNAAYFHVNHGASAAVYMKLVFKDSSGHVVRSRHI
jgi:hypothetical protein